MKEPRQKPVQISTPFHNKLNEMSDLQGQSMKWLIEDALKAKYPAFRGIK